MIREMLLKEHSKPNTMQIVHYIGNDPDKFAELIDCLCCDDNRICQRAAWPLSYSIEKHHELLTPHFERLIGMLSDKSKHTAVRRNIVRILQDIDVPEEFHGHLIDSCFNFVSDVNEPAAVRAFSMSVLERCTRGIPELREELKLIIEEHWEHSSPGFRGRGKEVLKKLKN